MKNEISDIKTIKNQFFGIYRGVVEEDNPLGDDNEPLKDGRIRVRVWGLHNINKQEVPTKHLPLAQPAYPVIVGSITGKGCWSVPTQGTHVFLFFENGDHMQPRYFATAPGIEPTDAEFDRKSAMSETGEGFKDPDGIYPLNSLMNEQDMNRLMRMGGYPAETAWDNLGTGEYSLCGDVGGIKFLPPGKTECYPEGLTIETRNGQTLDFGKDSTLLYNNGGAYMLMAPSEQTGQGPIWLMGHVDQIGGIRTDKMEVMGQLEVTNGGYWHTGSGTLPIGNCMLPFYNVVFCQFVTDMVNAFNNHTHIGVESGGDESGVPADQLPTDEATLSSYCTTTLETN